jgi:hypothetical protein
MLHISALFTDLYLFVLIQVLSACEGRTTSIRVVPKFTVTPNKLKHKLGNYRILAVTTYCVLFISKTADMYGKQFEFFIVLYIMVRKHIRCDTCQVSHTGKTGHTVWRDGTLVLLYASDNWQKKREDTWKRGCIFEVLSEEWSESLGHLWYKWQMFRTKLLLYKIQWCIVLLQLLKFKLK